MKVVISGLFYPFTMMHYFIRAFDRRDDVEIWTCGPSTGNWIPWDGGMTIPEKYHREPDFALPREAIKYKIHPQMVIDQIPWEKPDLWVQVDAGWHFSARPPGEVVAHIQTDPHVLKRTYDLPKSYSDFKFCMQTPYLEPGEFFLPYGYDPTVHYKEEKDKDYDACLIGLLYDTRKDLISRLRSKGFDVYYSIGEIYDEYRDRYNRSKIALSWSSKLDLPARVWEAFAMGVPLVTNRVPDLPTFFVEGEHYLGFDNMQDAEAKALMLILNDDLREEMADAAHRKVRPHTWDNRVQQLLETCKLI